MYVIILCEYIYIYLGLEKGCNRVASRQRGGRGGGARGNEEVQDDVRHKNDK